MYIPTVLILGLAGGGKSLLVRRLFSLATSASESLSLDYDVVPTAGVELQTLSIKRKPTITFREVCADFLAEICALVVVIWCHSGSFRERFSAFDYAKIMMMNVHPPQCRGLVRGEVFQRTDVCWALRYSHSTNRQRFPCAGLGWGSDASSVGGVSERLP